MKIMSLACITNAPQLVYSNDNKNPSESNLKNTKLTSELNSAGVCKFLQILGLFFI